MSLIELDSKFIPHDWTIDPLEGVSYLRSLKDKTCQGSEFTGWYDYAGHEGMAQLRDIEAYQDSLTIDYDCVVVVGIGGSYLGTKAISDALSHNYLPLMKQDQSGGKRPIFYLGHHLCERALLETLDAIDQFRPLVNIISKSGTTTEPGVSFRVIKNYLETRFGKAEAKARLVMTTDPNRGALHELAQSESYQEFPIPPSIGGRFSVFTAVGLLPLSLAGFATREFLEGADALFRELDSEDPHHPLVRYALLRHKAYQEDKKIEVLSFSDPSLWALSEWWKQLFGESEGKNGKGLFPAAMSYSTDLHSLGQYLQDGERHLMETFLTFKQQRIPHNNTSERRLRIPRASNDLDQLGYLEGRHIADVDEAAVYGSKIAHSDGGVPCLEIQLKCLDARNLGALMAFFCGACAVSALALGVNPFDQPGVEQYKKNLFALLGKPGFIEEGQKLRNRL